MLRRLTLLGLVSISSILAGCYHHRPLFPRFSGHCAGCAVPMTPVAPGPIFPRLHHWDHGYAVPASGPMYGGMPMANPGCAGCETHPGTVLSHPKGYGTGIPHDSALIPHPTIMPPMGTPKVEQTTDPTKEKK